MSLIIFILVLSILIVVHEFGHFLAAKKNGIRVEKFAIGFGPALFKRKGKETEFVICAFPLGGYVKLAGESRSESKGYDYEFFTKPAGVKMQLVLAGPLFNYICAFVLFWIIGVIGFQAPDLSQAIIGGVSEYCSSSAEREKANIAKDCPAYLAGLKTGDKILEVNHQKVKDWLHMKELISSSNKEVTIKIERAGEIFTKVLPLKETEVSDIFGRKKRDAVIGITPSLKREKYNILQGVFKAGEMLLSSTFFMLKGFFLIIRGELSFKDTVSGPIGIYFITADAVKMGIVAVLQLMAVLNVSLTIINLLPLPLLDGGHFFIFLVEKLRKRQISDRTEDFLTRLGFVILGLLIVFVLSNDVIKRIEKMKHSQREEAIGEIK
jgi:regulator of sigma E protease